MPIDYSPLKLHRPYAWFNKQPKGLWRGNFKPKPRKKFKPRFNYGCDYCLKRSNMIRYRLGLRRKFGHGLGFAVMIGVVRVEKNKILWM